MGMLKGWMTTGLLVCTIPLLAACNSTGGLSGFGNGPTEITLPETVEPVPDGDALRVARIHFAEGNFGHAARYYERAVEISPNHAEAWLGLAASYDRVRRFDLADRAYREAGRLIGDRAEYHNNVGYSYLLRGDLPKARAKFLQAYELDPTSITVNNNLELLRDTITLPKRR
jgi:Flp pilus assembly protein TadD